MPCKPLPRVLGHLFKCSGFFEEMGGSRDDRDLLGTAEEPVRVLIHLDDGLMVAADHEHGGRGHVRQVAFRKIRTSAARDDGTNRKPRPCGCLQGGAGSCAGAKVPQSKMLCCCVPA